MSEMIRASDLWTIQPGVFITTGRVIWQFLGCDRAEGQMLHIVTADGPRQVHLAQLLWTARDRADLGAPHGRKALAREVAHVRVRQPHGRVQGRQYLRKTSARIITALVERDGPGCHYCGRDLDAERAMTEGYTGPMPPWWPTKDHKLPKAAGGHDALENLLLSCFTCNNQKADTPYEDYVERLARRGRGPLVG